MDLLVDSADAVWAVHHPGDMETIPVTFPPYQRDFVSPSFFHLIIVTAFGLISSKASA